MCHASGQVSFCVCYAQSKIRDITKSFHRGVKGLEHVSAIGVKRLQSIGKLSCVIWENIVVPGEAVKETLMGNVFKDLQTGIVTTVYFCARPSRT